MGSLLSCLLTPPPSPTQGRWAGYRCIKSQQLEIVGSLWSLRLVMATSYPVSPTGCPPG